MNRPFAGDEPLAEHWVIKDQPEDLLALLEDLVAMRDEEQPFVALPCGVVVVEGGDPRLAGARRCDDEVSEVPALPLCVERLEHLELERLGLDMDAQSDRASAMAPGLFSASRAACNRSPSTRGSYDSNSGSCQYCSNVAADPLDDRGVVDSRGPNIPLEPVKQGGLREV